MAAGHGITAAATHTDYFDPSAGARFLFHLVLQIVHIHIHVAIDDAHGRLLTSTFCRSRLHFPVASRHVPSISRSTWRDPRRYTTRGRSIRPANPECLR